METLPEEAFDLRKGERFPNPTSHKGIMLKRIIFQTCQVVCFFEIEISTKGWGPKNYIYIRCSQGSRSFFDFLKQGHRENKGQTLKILAIILSNIPKE